MELFEIGVDATNLYEAAGGAIYTLNSMVKKS